MNESFETAAKGLRGGDCTRLAPLFGDASTPGSSKSRIVEWFDAGAFAGDPAALAESFTCACWLGRIGVAQYFLDHGVDPAAGTGTGMDAMHWAVNRGQLAVVRLLVARGVSIETVSMHETTALGTGIWSAIHEPCPDHLAIIEVLLRAGADTKAVKTPSGHAGVDGLLRSHLAK